MEVLIGIVVLILILYYVPIALYISAKQLGIKISLLKVMVYRHKKLPLKDLINWHKKLKSNQIDSNIETIITLYKEGLDLNNIVCGLIKAKDNGLILSFEKACEADRMNIDITRTVINTISNVEKEK